MSFKISFKVLTEVYKGSLSISSNFSKLLGRFFWFDSKLVLCFNILEVFHKPFSFVFFWDMFYTILFKVLIYKNYINH